ncbi:hypothetical protein MYAER_1971 [Microcystis aeruginosa NIES-2549]|uniref:Uncharacterized protein n=1 Tax=Microcystis aeruginosa NIES-2549 TaxID=1641812 RepID=A0A0F6U4J5_MICAE|nr:hypothetical protein MYAER_1971 [Microcystis aeruginosa NIES-2549]AOC52716.1 hypothetical protein amyaer_1995 [Microcystis aeruginosa NIES-2481]
MRIGTIGLGRSQVSGRNLVPEPPAISTARITSSQGYLFAVFKYFLQIMALVFLSRSS